MNNSMRQFLSMAFILMMGVSLRAQCLQLVWSDEFDGSSLDLTKWEPMIGDGCSYGICGWGNNEEQYYKAENATVSNGTLKITAKEERVRGKKYTSARLRTLNMGEWTYGRFEGRIKLPYGQGMWPAFWMLPTDEVYGGWPQSGEIDIMELVGHEPSTIHGTIHYGDPFPNNQNQGAGYTLHSGIFNDDFHEFAIEWEPGEIRWYIDGYLYSTKTSADVSPANWPFDQDFHFLLNVAVGGNWPGSPDNSTVFPQVMEVDYVRVYTGTAPSISGKRTVSYQASGEQYSINNASGGTSYNWSVPAGASIVSGQGSSTVTVDWGTTGGDIVVDVNSGCGSDQFVLNVEVEAAYILDNYFINFDDPDNVTLGTATGTYTPDVSNPGANGINGSALSAQYVRNSSEQYDVLTYDVSSITDASEYVNKQKKFFMDVYTDAPAGTLILLQLENSSSASTTNYPTGRHSRYQAYTSAQNQWERLEFSLLDQPDGSTPDGSVDVMVLLFASNSFTGNTYYFDNFDSYREDDGNPPANNAPTVSVTSPSDGTDYDNLATITVSADASDSDGNVQQVEFFVDGNSVGTDNSSPYSLNWTIPAFGAYEITAVATDDDNASTTSSAVNITATDPGSGPSYCSAQSSSASNEWIAGVSIGGFSNTSGKATYSDFTGITANLSSGSNSISLTPDYKGPNRSEYWRIWIDLNVDGDFNDAGELVFDAGSAQVGTLNSSMSIPSGAVTTRMRIIMQRDNAPSSCGTQSRGEVEDYTVSIDGGSARLGRSTGFLIYPNPAKDILHIALGQESKEANMQIMDQLGKIHHQKSFMNQTDVRISDLSRGVYIIRVQVGEEMTVKKFVKE